MSRIGVETAQHVQVQYQASSVPERILAFLIDLCVLGAYFISLSAIGVGSGEVDEGNIQWMTLLLMALPAWLYHLVLEVLWNGYSVGKWVVGIRVTKLDGSRPDLFNYLIRWFIRLFEVTLTSGGLALLVLLINGRGQRLGDIAAGTCVIKVRRKTRLSDTLYEDEGEGAEIRYPQVAELSDRDMAIVLEILDSMHDYERSAWEKLALKTQRVIEEKMGIQSREASAMQFLHQLKKDHNRVHSLSD